MAIRSGMEGKPWYWGVAIGLLVFGVLYFVMHQWQFADLESDIVRQERKLSDLQAQVQKGRIAKAQLPQFREEVRRLETELDKLLRILPVRRNTPDLLRRIRTLTEQADFEILRIRPGAFVDKDFYSEWPIAINLHGTYHDLAMFFDRISRFSRIINIENLRIKSLKQRNEYHSISATFNAKTFIYKEPDPEAEMNEAQSGSKRNPSRRKSASSKGAAK